MINSPTLFGEDPNLKGIGKVWLAKTSKGICRISLSGSKKDFLKTIPRDIEWIEDETAFSKLISDLLKFSEGRIVRFDEKLDLRYGTPFQKSVWKNIAKIVYGDTISYAKLAKKVGRPNAYRAVANACGANPVPIIVPCHRVIASDGTIGGFSGGVDLKRKLLASEGSGF